MLQSIASWWDIADWIVPGRLNWPVLYLVWLCFPFLVSFASSWFSWNVYPQQKERNIPIHFRIWIGWISGAASFRLLNGRGRDNDHPSLIEGRWWKCPLRSIRVLQESEIAQKSWSIPFLLQNIFNQSSAVIFNLSALRSYKLTNQQQQQQQQHQQRQTNEVVFHGDFKIWSARDINLNRTWIQSNRFCLSEIHWLRRPRKWKPVDWKLSQQSDTWNDPKVNSYRHRLQ